VRQGFADQLAAIETRLERAFAGATEGLVEVGHALGRPTRTRVAEIAEGGRGLRRESREVDSQMVIVTARQAPVAGDLRLVLALIQLAQHATLIANQFELISEQLGEIDGDVPDRQQNAPKLREMARLAGTQLGEAVRAFTTRDPELAQRIDHDDDAIDRLNREVFEATLQLEAPTVQRQLAMRHVLIARSLERIGDNAVDIAEQAAFLVSAELREFTDASRPRARRPG
jgi:phosphate transport system protein